MSGLTPRNLILLLAALVVVGTLGFRVIQGWSWLDCVWMTVMTLTTVGYGSPGPLSAGGKVFSTLLMLFGIGLMLYLLTLLAEHATRGFLDPATARRRKEKRIMNLREHTIVCGYGQVGEAVAASLLSAGRRVVVIDQLPERIAWADSHGLYTVEGDATDEDVLRRAGIESAAALVSVMHSDPANLYVVVSARSLAPGVRLIARAGDEAATRKIRRAGADEVVNPYQLSGTRIANLMLAPKFSQVLSGSSVSEHFTVREVPVPAPFVGWHVGRIGQETGALVVGIWRDGRPLLAQAREELRDGDTLLLAGTATQVDRVSGGLD